MARGVRDQKVSLRDAGSDIATDVYGTCASAAASDRGRLAFADLSWKPDVWATPIDADRGVVSGERGAAPPRQLLADAERFLARGLALDPDSAMVLNTLAMLRMFQWRWHEAEPAYRRAIALEPANPHPHMMYALHCSFLGPP